MKTIEVLGLGQVSVTKVAQIELCDEVGYLETFHLGTAIKAINARRINELPVKAMYQAAFKLKEAGLLETFGPGMYKWTAKGWNPAEAQHD